MAGALPPNLSFFMQRLQGVSTSQFKIQPQTSGTVGAGGILRFDLPSNSYVNMGKGGIRLFFNATTGTSTGTTGGRLPNGIDKLIHRIAVYAGGTLIQNAYAGYNVVKSAKEALGAAQPLCAAYGHPECVRATSYHNTRGSHASTAAVLASAANEGYSQTQDQFCIDIWDGFLGSIRPEICDLGLMPLITIELTLADSSIIPVVAGEGIAGTASTGVTVANSTATSFEIKNASLQVEVMGFATSVLDELAESRISQVGYLSLPFKQYFTHESSHTTDSRFSVNSQSLDRLWFIYRASGFANRAGLHSVLGYRQAGGTISSDGTNLNLDVGVPQIDNVLPDVDRERLIAPYFRFEEPVSNKVTGKSAYQLQINGASIPAYKMNRVEALGMTLNSLDDVDPDVHKNMTLAQYTDSFFVQCYRFNLPGSDYSRLASGLDTRSVSALCSLNTEGTQACNLIVAAEVTSELRVGAGRAVQVVQ